MWIRIQSLEASNLYCVSRPQATEGRSGWIVDLLYPSLNHLSTICPPYQGCEHWSLQRNTLPCERNAKFSHSCWSSVLGIICFLSVSVDGFEMCRAVLRLIKVRFVKQWVPVSVWFSWILAPQCRDALLFFSMPSMVNLLRSIKDSEGVYFLFSFVFF